MILLFPLLIVSYNNCRLNTRRLKRGGRRRLIDPLAQWIPSYCSSHIPTVGQIEVPQLETILLDSLDRLICDIKTRRQHEYF